MDARFVHNRPPLPDEYLGDADVLLAERAGPLDARIRDRHFREDRSHVACTDFAGRKHPEGDGYGAGGAEPECSHGDAGRGGGWWALARRAPARPGDGRRGRLGRRLRPLRPANWNTNHGTDPSGTALASALGVASANLYTNDGTTSTVTVNISPAKYSGGPNAGTTLPPGYAEATVTWYQPRFFSGIFGSGAIPVSARAVARGVRPLSGPHSSRFPPRGVSRVVVRGRMNQGLGDSGVWSARHSNKRTLFPGWDSFGSVLVKCR